MTAELSQPGTFHPALLPPPVPRPISGTHVYLLENSHPGFEPLVTAQQPALPPGNQQNALGFPADVRQTRVRSRCTGQERDSETTLDNFLVRYYDPAQGRFQGPDPANAGADPSNPQSWNGFGYVGNNPMSFTDPSGESFWSVFAGIFSGLGTFLATGDPLAGAEVGLGVDNTIDSIENGKFPLAGLLELAGGGIGIAGDLLGGVAGGTVNSGGVFGGGSSGPYVFNYNSAYHLAMTLGAGGTLAQAWGVLWVDAWPGSQGTDAAHAMGGGKGVPDAIGAYNEGNQTCGEAYAGAVAQLRNARGQPSLAIHIIQDSYSPSHDYQNWNGRMTLTHEKGDWTINSAYSNATNATRRYLQALSGKTPMGTPESYLAPRPASCR